MFLGMISLQLAFMGKDFQRDRPISRRIQEYTRSMILVLGGGQWYDRFVVGLNASLNIAMLTAT